MSKKNKFTAVKTYFFLGLKFGFFGALVGFILHIFWGNLEEVIYTIFSGLSIGFFIGIFEIIFANPKLRRFPYLLILSFRIVIYFFITIICIYIVLIIYLKNLGLESSALINPVMFEEIQKVYLLTNINLLYVLIFTIVATFTWQLKSFFAKGVLLNYISGKYHKPRIEDRIFMFLDLNDATTIAEKLGPKNYSMLLSDFFNDLDEAFTKTNGQIFQYVGDEVVIIWNVNNGLRNNNCISSYLLAEEIIKNKKEHYVNKFGILPSFKAAYHLGEVTITEIGVSKKEIVYHGDTINTTSRICSSANAIGEKILVSKTLHDRLKSDITFRDLGEHSFKGKKEKIHIYSM